MDKMNEFAERIKDDILESKTEKDIRTNILKEKLEIAQMKIWKNESKIDIVKSMVEWAEEYNNYLNEVIRKV
jgi:hypothetical protein